VQSFAISRYGSLTIFNCRGKGLPIMGSDMVTAAIVSPERDLSALLMRSA